MKKNKKIVAEAHAAADKIQACPECDAEHCVFNPKGFCRLLFVTGESPRLSDDGCKDYTYRNED